MAQKISSGNIFGRIGSGIGEGLAEQIPKEMDRSRLASGLQDFEKNHQDLSPMQQLARLSAIPGITPQMIQSFAEMSKIQNQGNAFRRAGQGQSQGQQGEGAENGMRASADLSQVKEANLLDQAVNAGKQAQEQPKPSANTTPQLKKQEQLTNANASAPGKPQLANYNPADPRALTRLPWTPPQRNQRISEYINNGFLPEQAKDLAADDEQRELAIPGAVKQQQQEKKTRAQEAEDVFTKQLETRLQKSDEGVYTDITGDMLADLKRAMSRAVVENPNASAEDIAEDFSKRALRLAKTKKEVEGLAATTGPESLFTGDKVLNKLRSYQKIFEDAGNQEEYFNILRSQFGLSPQGAAIIAFPAQGKTKEFIDSYKPKNTTAGRYGSLPDVSKIDNNSRKAALDVSKTMGEDDSILAIARMLSEKDQYFDQRVFFEEISTNPSIRLNGRQKTEAAMGEKDILPTWGDFKIFPLFRRSTK